MHFPSGADGNAVVYCQHAFTTPNGKTAHGLVRFTRRYRVAAVIDERYAGQDAGDVLDRRPCGIPIYGDLGGAIEGCRGRYIDPTHFVIGLAPDGGRLADGDRQAVLEAVSAGLHVDAGLHDFLCEDEQISALAREKGVRLRDIRMPPDRKTLHFFSGKIEGVDALKVAVLGTDSAVGKRTTAWLLVHALNAVGQTAELVGTGQTAWLQGARYSLVLDSLVNDFVSGEIEHAVWSAWRDQHPDVIVIEGQGSLMNPAYPGGFEILAAGRPDVVVLQHAPTRRDYDGFPGYPIHPLTEQIKAVELLSGKPVIAVTVNTESLAPSDVPAVCAQIKMQTGLPAYDVLGRGSDALAADILERLKNSRRGKESRGE